MSDLIEYVVIDDHGDHWEHGEIAFGPFKSQRKAEEKAEDENYHSASIVRVVNGIRVEKVGP